MAQALTQIVRMTALPAVRDGLRGLRSGLGGGLMITTITTTMPSRAGTG